CLGSTLAHFLHDIDDVSALLLQHLHAVADSDESGRPAHSRTAVHHNGSRVTIRLDVVPYLDDNGWIGGRELVWPAITVDVLDRSVDRLALPYLSMRS
ncbi:hypothetical protein PENTCL1PPCAC_11913, partial [Pristionchus entomophagus]